MANLHASIEVTGAHTRPRVILRIQIAIVSSRFVIGNDCTSGAQPLVARACVPVCPSLAKPLHQQLKHYMKSLYILNHCMPEKKVICYQL